MKTNPKLIFDKEIRGLNMYDKSVFSGLKGKKVLITGATGDIGQEITKEFSKNGAIVGIHYNKNKEEAEKIKRVIEKSGGKAEIFKADLINSKERDLLINLFVNKFGRIDILVNNAGAVFKQEPLHLLDEKTWDDTFSLNLKAPFFLTKKAFEYMIPKHFGRIINISSVNVKYGGSGRSIHYVAAKAGLETITITFAKEGAKHNILVNAIRCGMIDTNMRKKVKGYTEEDYNKRKDLILLKRAGKPEDIARMVIFLASDAGNFITKEIFTIAGGD